MRPWLRKLFGCGFAVLAIGLAWWGWHLPPAPVCELEGSNDCDVIGYSADGKWFAARLIVDDESSQTRCTYIWNARTGEKVQTLPQNYRVALDDYHGPPQFTDTWKTIELLRQNDPSQKFVFEFTDGGARLLPIPQPTLSPPVLRDCSTIVWYEDYGKKKYRDISHAPNRMGEIPDPWWPAHLVGNGRAVICQKYSGSSISIWDVDRQCMQTEMVDVEAYSLTRDGRHAVFATADKLELWDLQRLAKRVIPRPAVIGFEKNDLVKNVVILLAPGGRQLIAPVCGSRQDFVIMELDEPMRARRFHLPEPLKEGASVPQWWFDGDGQCLFYRNEHGEIVCWSVAADPPQMVASIGWQVSMYGIRLAGQTEPLANDGWAVGPWKRPKYGACVSPGNGFLGPSANVFLGGPPATGALGFAGGAPPTGFGIGGIFGGIGGAPRLGFAGGNMQTGLGFGGGFEYSFSSDSKWLIQNQSYVDSPSPIVLWFGQFFPVGHYGTFADATELVDLSERKILGCWTNVNSTWFSPDGKFIAVQLTKGPISIWGLPPKPRWLVPILLQIPLLGVVWHWRPRFLRRVRPG